MADEQDPSGPSLEPPSFFKRKKRDQPADPDPVVDDSPTTILDDPGAAEMTQPLAPPVPPAPAPPAPLVVDEPPAAAEVTPAAEATPAPEATPASDETPAPAETPAPKPPREGPIVPGRVAAAAAGLLVGALIVGLTAASFELCSRVQGTNSCGGPGFFLLVAILVLAVVLGTVVLRVCDVAEPGSTSFLAVGLTSVIALLFLIDELFDWSMIVAIPLVSVVMFLLSHWVTATFVEPARPESSPADEDWFHHIR